MQVRLLHIRPLYCNQQGRVLSPYLFTALSKARSK